jgi:hypothetical protein
VVLIVCLLCPGSFTATTQGLAASALAHTQPFRRYFPDVMPSITSACQLAGVSGFRVPSTPRALLPRLPRPSGASRWLHIFPVYSNREHGLAGSFGQPPTLPCRLLLGPSGYYLCTAPTQAGQAITLSPLASDMMG